MINRPTISAGGTFATTRPSLQHLYALACSGTASDFIAMRRIPAPRAQRHRHRTCTSKSTTNMEELLIGSTLVLEDTRFRLVVPVFFARGCELYQRQDCHLLTVTLVLECVICKKRRTKHGSLVRLLSRNCLFPHRDECCVDLHLSNRMQTVHTTTLMTP